LARRRRCRVRYFKIAEIEALRRGLEAREDGHGD
jgi:hypothetical protein